MVQATHSGVHPSDSTLFKLEGRGQESQLHQPGTFSVMSLEQLSIDICGVKNENSNETLALHSAYKSPPFMHMIEIIPPLPLLQNNDFLKHSGLFGGSQCVVPAP